MEKFLNCHAADNFGVILVGGVVDSDYTGSLKVLYYNSSKEEIIVPPKTPLVSLRLYEIYTRELNIYKETTKNRPEITDSSDSAQYEDNEIEFNFVETEFD